MFSRDVQSKWEKCLEAERQLRLKPNEKTFKAFNNANKKWDNAAERYRIYLDYLRDTETEKLALMNAD